MDAAAILALIEKGLTMIEVLVEAGKNAAPAFTALKNVITGQREGTLTEEALTKTEALLDQMLAEFNEPLPPAQPGDPDYVKPVA